MIDLLEWWVPQVYVTSSVKLANKKACMLGGEGKNVLEVKYVRPNVWHITYIEHFTREVEP